MLSSLYIENIAVAKKIEIEFSEGFTVITGQTGAGKSIIIDAILLLCGAKNYRELIRTGEESAAVSAIFRVSDAEKAALGEYDIEADDNGELEIMRTITADGRSAARVNRRTVPVSVLRDITSVLLGIQTQDERNEYADRNSYIRLLDLFAADSGELSEYKERYSVILDLESKIAALRKAVSDKEMMLDILKYQKKEIDSAKLSADDEEQSLIKLRNKIKSLEKVSKCSQIVTKCLSTNEKGVTAPYLIERAEAAIEQLSDVLEGADEMAGKLKSFRYELIDIAERVSDQLEDGDISDPEAKLTQIESRLNLIEKLERKYGSTIKEIKEKREEIVQKISDLEDSDFRVAELEKQLDEARADAAAAASVLHEKRTAAAGILEEKIITSLEDLDMPKVRFRITADAVKNENGYVFRPDGYDDVDFLISVNIGEEIQSLGKVSSGGELSRITLAIKTAFADTSGAGCLIFDEIDTGVSGGTSEKIGRELLKLSEGTQVISVTHSPQIASIASSHLLIEKHENGGRTESTVRYISGEDRTAEIARIIGGVDITEKQTAAAAEMLTNNKN